MLRRSLRQLSVALIALAVVSVSGCAGERDPINRVQPNYVAKSYFDGEWHYASTLVSVPAGDAATAAGFGEWDLKSVTWDVQKDWLLARRTYEIIDGADSLEREGDDYEGTILAAYRIQSHFDIQKSYNQATGEEYNILSENMSDRPWYDREYIRVDWSTNYFDSAGLGGFYSGNQGAPGQIHALSFFKECEDGDRNSIDGTCNSEPDAPVFVDGYFDVTSRYIAKPGSISMWGYNNIPLCWLYGFMECTSQEFTLRHSFKRKDPNHKFEKRSYKGPETELFGYFDTMRMSYNYQENIREQNKVRYMNRHPIWTQESFNDDGSLKDVSQRKAQPIVYHVNRDFPTQEEDPVIYDTAVRVAREWDAVFSNVVAQLGVAPPAGGKMFVLCPHNPVREGDSVWCGEAGTSPRIGDLRYSMLGYMPDYMSYGLLGLGPSNNDLLTGEIVAGSAYVYHYNNTAAWDVTQMILLLNGDLDPEQYIDGLDMTDWIDEVNSGSLTRQMDYELEDARSFVQHMVAGPHARYWDGRRQAPGEEDIAYQKEHGHKAWLMNFMDDFEQRGLIEKNDGVAAARLSNLHGTEIEGMLMTDDLLGSAGVLRSDLAAQLDERGQDFSPLRGAFDSQRHEMLQEFFMKQNMFVAEFADAALLGLAKEYKNSNLSSEEIFQAVRARIYFAVMAHEIGHSLGLMHNFGASDDAINYFPKYWEIRDDGYVGPRIDDPMSQDEIDQSIYNYGYSSVMDYAGRYTIDGTGLGRYDMAAIMWGYGDLVQVFKDIGSVDADTLKSWADDDGEVLSLGAAPSATHYTYFYNRMGPSLYDENNREWVKTNELIDAYKWTADGRARVPYIYCSHGRSDLGDSCLTRDFGADTYERLTGILDDVDTWYVMRNFNRGKISSGYDDVMGYVRRYMGRTYMRIKRWHDVYGLYKQLLPRYYSDQQLEEFFMDPVEGWGVQTQGVQMAFNHLVKVLFTPDIKGWKIATDTLGNELTVENPYVSGDEFTTDITNARFYSTAWSYGYNGERDCGYYWYDCLHHMGYYLDKIMAIQALTDSETYFVARATPEDIREWKVGYFSTFRDQLLEINRALMAGDYSGVGPYVADPEAGKMAFPNYTDLNSIKVDHSAGPGFVVDPAATFTIQLYWQIFGKARFSGTFDMEFQDRSYIWGLDGATPDVDPARVVSFEDPFSSMKYFALTFNGEGAAEAMLDRANALYVRSSLCNAATEACVDPSFVLDEGTYAPTEAEQLEQARNRTTEELRKYVQLIKVNEMLSREMFGSVYIGNPYNP